MGPKEQANTRRLLKRIQRRKPYADYNKYPVPSKNWHSDAGRRLEHYERIHHFLLEQYGKHGLKGLKLTHLGASLGLYGDFLKRYYGIEANAVETNQTYIAAGKLINLSPTYIKKSAEKTGIKKGSQQVVISDHFLFAGYEKINDYKVLLEAKRILAKKGLLLVERSNKLSTAELDLIRNNGFSLTQHSIEKMQDSTNASHAFYVFQKND